MVLWTACGNKSATTTTPASSSVPVTSAVAITTVAASSTATPGATNGDICSYAQVIASSFTNEASTVAQEQAFAANVTAAIAAIGKVVPSNLASAWQTESSALQGFFTAMASANYDPKVFLSRQAFQDAMTSAASPAVQSARVTRCRHGWLRSAPI
jgi:hypothetical protein